jgi:hypothetical protein
MSNCSTVTKCLIGFLLSAIAVCGAQESVRLGFVTIQTVAVEANGSEKMEGGVIVRLFGERKNTEAFALSGVAGIVQVPVRPGTYCYEAFSDKGKSLALKRAAPERVFFSSGRRNG